MSLDFDFWVPPYDYLKKKQHGYLLTNLIWYHNMPKNTHHINLSGMTVCKDNIHVDNLPTKSDPIWMLPKKRFAKKLYNTTICKKLYSTTNLQRVQPGARQLKRKLRAWLGHADLHSAFKLFRPSALVHSSSINVSKRKKENVERGLAWAVNISWLAPSSNVSSASSRCYSLLPLCSHKTNTLIIIVRILGAVKTWFFFYFFPLKDYHHLSRKNKSGCIKSRGCS